MSDMGQQRRSERPIELVSFVSYADIRGVPSPIRPTTASPVRRTWFQMKVFVQVSQNSDH
jgi:hypothetical protein